MIPAFAEPLRNGQRFRLSFPLTVRIRKKSVPLVAWREESAFVESTCTENISSGGCYFLLSQELPVGTKVELEITLPGGMLGVPEGKLCCRGRVIRVESLSGGERVGVASTIDSYHFGKASDQPRGARQVFVV